LASAAGLGEPVLSERYPGSTGGGHQISAAVDLEERWASRRAYAGRVKQEEGGSMTVYSGRFAGRTAIITGGASGLGRETAGRIVAEGGQVALWDINAEHLEEAKSAIGAIHTVALDVSDYAQVAKAAQSTKAALGKVDILLASAGITGATAPVHEFPVDSWRRVIDINLNGLFYCCREVVPLMLENGYGRIVNVASVAGKEGNPNASAYSASKAAVIGFTKSLGKELATQGVLVNSITPAAFESPILSQMPQSQIDYMRSKIPMGRLGGVEETAALVCWLVSEECSFSTAATFDTSGGRTTY
jgi:NAD(P)-dependent dehydrogenase (short-subunit alcohol dehydrogenase family)